MMKLTHSETIKYPSGLIKITVVIHRQYTYLLQSEYAHQRFLKEVRSNKYGAALNTLKKFNCTKGKNEINKTKP